MFRSSSYIAQCLVIVGCASAGVGDNETAPQVSDAQDVGGETGSHVWNWRDIEILFVSDHRVQIRQGNETKSSLNYTPERIRTSDLWFRRTISIWPALLFQPFRLVIFTHFRCCLDLIAHYLPTSLAHQIETKSFGLSMKRPKYGRRVCYALRS